MVRLPVLTTLLDELPIGVILLDPYGKVVHYNRYEEVLASRRRENVVGRPFFEEIAPCMNVKELGGRFYENIGREPLSVEVEFAFPLPFLDQPRDVMVRMVSFEVDQPYGCLLVEDISARRSVERMKESLSSLLVHDLKSPLAVVMAHLGLLARMGSVKADPDALESARAAAAAGHRLQHMITNLLDITRLETNAVPIRPTPTDLGFLVREVVSDAAVHAQTYGVKLATEAPDDALVVDADGALVRRALDNLVDNAVRYARERVVVRAARTAFGARLEVVDDGPGIPESLQADVFEKYAQVEAADGTPRPNRGLGLTFVRLVARAHGGDVDVRCPSTGGTTFGMDLPRPPAG